MQLIGFVAGRINACEFGKDLVNLSFFQRAP